MVSEAAAISSPAADSLRTTTVKASGYGAVLTPMRQKEKRCLSAGERWNGALLS